MTSSIAAHGLTKTFDRQPVVSNLSFSVAKGTILGFLGPNGAGKSTTMKMLTGYLPPSAGKVQISGYDMCRQPLQAKQHIGYLPEHNPMYLNMYVREYLQFMGQLRGLSTKACDASKKVLIARCGLGDVQHKQLGQLSKGYRQRVGLAQALIHDPKVLILDEPTTGLDPNQLYEIRALIKEVAKDKAIVLSTHIMQEVEALCDQVLIIHQGKMKTHSSLAQLTGTASQSVMVTFKMPITSKGVKLLAGIAACKAISDRAFLLTAPASQDLQAPLLAMVQQEQWPLESIRKQSLEEIFQSFTLGDA